MLQGINSKTTLPITTKSVSELFKKGFLEGWLLLAAVSLRGNGFGGGGGGAFARHSSQLDGSGSLAMWGGGLGVSVCLMTPFYMDILRRQCELLEIEMHNERLLVAIANNTARQ